MRYFVQFVIPALIFIALVYLVGKRRGLSHSQRHSGEHPAGTAGGRADAPIISNTTFVLALVIGAAFTVALLFGLAQL